MKSRRSRGSDPYAESYGQYETTGSASRDESDRSWIRRHRVLTSLLAILALFIAGTAGFALWLNNSLGNIERVPLTINDSVRPAPTQGQGMNVLLLGTDAGSGRNTDGKSILQDAASGNWPSGKYRSDATMVMHIPEDKKSVTVMSIPRDSYVKLYDDTGREVGKQKINAALSLYGPSGAVSTVENLTNLRIDHIVMIDWDGFENITDALGGVEMTTDTGTQRYDGASALKYVRERKTVEGGDLGRVKRQQNYLRAMMAETFSGGTTSNPLQMRKTVDTVSKNVAVDDGWSTGDMRSLAWSMRSLRPRDVTFMTVPTAGTRTDPAAGSIVVLDETPFVELFDAVRAGQLAQFIEANPDLRLPTASRVD